MLTRGGLQVARATRKASLESRSARSKLRVGRRYWVRIGRGLSLGYRRAPTDGTWYIRLRLESGKHDIKSLGVSADDFRDPNGRDVLDYFQAQALVRERKDEHDRVKIEAETGAEPAEPCTVEWAFDKSYHPWLKAHRKTAAESRRVFDTHIRPAFGTRLVAELTTKQIRDWHEGMAAAPPRLRSRKGGKVNHRAEFDPRARRATANRVLTVMKATLNHVFREGHLPAGAADQAWRRVRPFRNVARTRAEYLSEAECTRLINACDLAFRPLVRVALYTGCRYGELARLRCEDFNPDAGTVHVVDPKNGVPRHVVLTDAAQQFFSAVTAGRARGELVFQRAAGSPWGHAHQIRPMKAACERASIDPPVSFHVLRHTVAAQLAMKGVSLQVIAELLGHADTRITEKHYAHLRPSYVADTIRANLADLGGVEGDEQGKVARLG